MKQSSVKTPYLILGISLLIMAFGQLLLSFGRDFVDAQRPIDWAHWLLMAGAVGGAASFSKMRLRTLGKVARLLVVTGALAFTGMVAIDILLWTIPDNAAFDDAIDTALGAPGVAVPFLWVGPSLFFIGLMLQAIEWWRHTPWAAGFILVGTLLSGIGQATRNHSLVLLSFVLMLIGLGGLWAGKK
jgi:hypothetical protein